MKAYQLHDTETEEILGTVIVKKTPLDGKMNALPDEVHEGWVDFNQLQEHEEDHTNVDVFVEWFNKGYVTQIEVLDLDFVQP